MKGKLTILAGVLMANSVVADSVIPVQKNAEELQGMALLVPHCERDTSSMYGKKIPGGVYSNLPRVNGTGMCVDSDGKDVGFATLAGVFTLRSTLDKMFKDNVPVQAGNVYGVEYTTSGAGQDGCTTIQFASKAISGLMAFCPGNVPSVQPVPDGKKTKPVPVPLPSSGRVEVA
jgi:predicted RNA-binding protein with TRAM domain